MRTATFRSLHRPNDTRVQIALRVGKQRVGPTNAGDVLDTNVVWTVKRPEGRGPRVVFHTVSNAVSMGSVYAYQSTWVKKKMMLVKLWPMMHASKLRVRS